MELIGRRVPVIMDPVFLYSKEDWKNIVPYQGTYDFPYILCYFLGDNVEYRKRTLEFSKKQEIKIVALNFCNSYLDFDKCFGDIVPYDVSPDRFLNLIRNASFICTDSFHGAAFSIIHHKQFAIFDRYVSESSISRNSRIDSLCENLGLMNVRANGKTDLSEILLKFIDYKDVDNKLLKYKEKAKDYLNIAFDGIASSHF